jgi:senataxin
MAKLRRQPWHASTILGPYRFFDVEGVQTKETRGHSFINIPELNAAIRLYQRLKADYRSVDLKGKIGIITTYKAQLIEMKSRFVQKFGDSIFDEIEFNTTDAFQGREREIIIFSCVRAKASGGIGFLGDIRRMNVGLTRAKSSLWVLGDSRSLKQGEFWNRLIEDAKDRDRYSGGDVMGLFSKPTTRMQPVLPSHSKGTLSAPVSPLLASDKSYPVAVKGEDSDVEMVDAPRSAPSSRNAPIGGAKVGSSEAVSNRSLDPMIKRAPGKSSAGVAGEAGRKSSGGGMAALGINPHGKRPREATIKEEGVPIKKVS